MLTASFFNKFGDSQVVSKVKLPHIVQAVIRHVVNFLFFVLVFVLTYPDVYSSLASPESETAANTLVLVGHNIQGDLSRLEMMKISE